MDKLIALYVRVQNKAAIEQFYRCGERFTRGWRRVEVDAATAERLHAEQMLEVSEDEPEGYEPEPVDESASAAEQAEAAAARAEAAAKKAQQAATKAAKK